MMNENRKGYKKTKLGWIPEDWQLLSIDEITDRITKRVEVEEDKEYQQIGIRSHGKGIFRKEKVTGKSLGKKRVFWIEPDCFIVNIVFAWEQAVAKTTEKEVGMIASHRFPMYQPKAGILNLDYLLYFFKTPRGKHLLGLASPGGAGRNKTLGQKEFGKSLILIPSLKEQQSIVNILSTWDQAIEKFQLIIHNLNLRKEGLIQRVLTGTVRLKEFRREWGIKKFGEIITYKKGFAFKSYQYKGKGVRVIRISDTNSQGIKENGSIYISIEAAEKYKEYELLENDIIIQTVGSRPPLFDKQSSINPRNIVSSIKAACRILFYDKGGTAISYQNKDGFSFTLDTTKNLKYKSYKLEPPLFVFDPSRLRTNSGSDYGLRNFGPYDAGQFTPKEPSILVICHQNTRGRATEFLKGLIDGMPQSKYFTKGLKSKYELHHINLDVQEVSSYEISEIEQITRKLKYTPDIVIIEIPVSFKNERVVSRSLYYQSKAHFLNLQIPIQIINTENINRFDEYKLNAIALQMYAKLGGIPWTIQTKDSVDKEIIIGIGNSIFRNNAYQGNKQERIVGISTFFSADGQYMMSGDIKDVPYEDYFQELLDSLRDSIKTLSKEYAWQENQTVRFVFHIFKPIKNIEFEVVKELVKEFTNYKIQFAFVTISERHPYIMYDKNQRGVKKWNKTIGEYVPFRGTNIVIDDSTCLVQMLGIKEMKTGKHGASNPILIRILKPTSYGVEDDIEPYLFHDLHYITQQIFKFTYLSWRGFMPNQKPATMLYSGLISKLLGKLRQISGWKSEVINFNLKRKKWFL